MEAYSKLSLWFEFQVMISVVLASAAWCLCAASYPATLHCLLVFLVPCSIGPLHCSANIPSIFVFCHTSVATPAVTHSTLPFSVLQIHLVLTLTPSNTCFLSFSYQYLSKLCAFWDRMPSLVPAFGYQHFGATHRLPCRWQQQAPLLQAIVYHIPEGHNRIAL